MKNKFTSVLKRIALYIFGLIMFGYAMLWAFSLKSYEATYGLSFSPQYAEYLGLNADETLDALLSLKPDFIRLAVPWTEVEPRQRAYDFTEIDQMLQKASDAKVPVVLTLGQKIPRWPECYFPKWSAALSQEDRNAALLSYVSQVVNRYKHNSIIEQWQVENEPYIQFNFGECLLFDTASVKKEIALVRELDPSRKIVVTDSGELSTWREAAQAGDILGTTLYRTIRVNDWFTWRYDFVPSALYKIRTALWGKNTETFYVSELQAEPWFSDDNETNKIDFTDTKTLTPERLRENVRYAETVGASRISLWGGEWWYYMKTKANDDRYWTTATELFERE